MLHAASAVDRTAFQSGQVSQAQVSGVTESVRQVHGGAMGLRAAVERMAERLEAGGVLMPVPPTNAGQGAAVPTPLRCPLAAELSSAAGEMHALESLVQTLLDRLQV